MCHAVPARMTQVHPGEMAEATLAALADLGEAP